MKRMIVSVVALFCAVAVLAADGAKAKKMTLDEAREQITAIVANPEKMGEVIGQLSAEDQKTFLADVNKAIASMPGSNEAKTAKFLTVDREALLNAEKGNLQNLVATMFATVPLESLTVMAERYGEDLFNRSADATKTFTDEQFTEIASSTVKEVAKACEGLSDAPPRDTLAIYLFEKASNGTIAGLEDRLLGEVISDPQIRKVAKEEWLAAANGEGADRFSALLGYAEAGRAPNVDVSLKIAGPQIMAALLADLGNCVTDSKGNRIYPNTMGESPSERGLVTSDATGKSQTDIGITRVPKTSVPILKWRADYTRQNAEEKVEEAKKELGGYLFQE